MLNMNIYTTCSFESYYISISSPSLSIISYSASAVLSANTSLLSGLLYCSVKCLHLKSSQMSGEYPALALSMYGNRFKILIFYLSPILLQASNDQFLMHCRPHHH